MNILIAHNTYQHRGGEDSTVEAEAALLRQHGHEVLFYQRHNDEIAEIPDAAVAVDTLWSRRTAAELRVLFARQRPDVIHVHNTFPLISPSLFWVAYQEGIPVVQTLHNFRLLCPQAMLLREDKVCEDCVGHFPWRGVLHRCYRNSLLQTGVLTAKLALHRIMGTYRNKVTRYIALNDFCRDVFVRGGLPATRLRVKPNFVDLPAIAPQARSGFLFVGRLSTEKGINTLADALTNAHGLECEVLGVGSEEKAIIGIEAVRMRGWLPTEAVIEHMRGAIALVMPSLCYENFPCTLVEAFACGLPVIASRLGAMQALIRDGETGLLFEPGNAADLAEKMLWAAEHPAEMQRMGAAARHEYEQQYTPERNYQMLMDIYREAIDEVSGHAG